MLAKLILTLQNWSALRRFPGGLPKGSFICFDYRAGSGVVHDRVTIQYVEGIVILNHQESNEIDGAGKCARTQLTSEELQTVFQWLATRFPSKSAVLSCLVGYDYIGFRLFASDDVSGYRCAVSINDILLHRELRYFRRDLLDVISRFTTTKDAH